MAGDWIKMRAGLLQSPRLIAMCRALHTRREFRDWLTPGGSGQANGQIVSDDALRCVTSALLLRVWSAAREFGKFDGEDLYLDGIGIGDLDVMAGCAGVGESMVAVGWASFIGGVVTLPNFKQHNAPMTNSERQSEFRKRRSKGPDGELEQHNNVLRNSNDCSVTRALPEREESERRVPSLKSDRISNGSADAKSGGNTRSASRHRSPKVVSDEASQDEPFDLSCVDWGRVGNWAESVGRKIPAKTIDDRRMWLKFAVMADTVFCEDWLVDSVEAVLQAKQTRSTRQAHLVAVLKSKAMDDHGIDEKNFLAILGRIEIPKSVWKSSVLEVR